MKKCFVCEKEIESSEDKVCQTCLEFFKWKHGKKFLKHLEKLKGYFSEDSNSIKFRRKK